MTGKSKVRVPPGVVTDTRTDVLMDDSVARRKRADRRGGWMVTTALLSRESIALVGEISQVAPGNAALQESWAPIVVLLAMLNSYCEAEAAGELREGRTGRVRLMTTSKPWPVRGTSMGNAEEFVTRCKEPCLFPTDWG